MMIRATPTEDGTEDLAIKQRRSRQRWFIRAAVILSQLVALAATIVILHESNPIFAALMSVVAAMMLMLNDLLLGVAKRVARVVSTIALLAILVIPVAAFNPLKVQPPTLGEWAISLIGPVLGIVLLALPEPDYGTDLFGLKTRKKLGWFLAQVLVVTVLSVLLIKMFVR